MPNVDERALHRPKNHPGGQQGCAVLKSTGDKCFGDGGCPTCTGAVRKPSTTPLRALPGGFPPSLWHFPAPALQAKGITSRRGAASSCNTPRTPAGIPHPQAHPLAVQLVDEHITKLLQGARLKLAPRIWRPENTIPLNYGVSTALFRRHQGSQRCPDEWVRHFLVPSAQFKPGTTQDE